MFLIVGLGNPGKEYEHTPHNAGFMALDEYKKTHGEQKDLIFLKPQTFMNKSGIAIKKIIRNLKFEIRNLIVMHDDIDLPLGTLKISFGSGSGGHKGVESIIKNLGTKDFIRIRIGIKPATGKPANVEEFVLKKFSKQELQTLKQAIENSSSAIETIPKHGLEKAMTEWNK